jgi:hypothetical protein
MVTFTTTTVRAQKSEASPAPPLAQQVLAPFSTAGPQTLPPRGGGQKSPASSDAAYPREILFRTYPRLATNTCSKPGYRGRKAAPVSRAPTHPYLATHSPVPKPTMALVIRSDPAREPNS